MEEKYLKFYNKFIRHSKTVSDGRVVSFAELIQFEIINFSSFAFMDYWV